MAKGNFDFGVKFQRTVCAMIVNDSQFSTRAMEYLSSKNFTSEPLGWLFDLCKLQHNAGKRTPTEMMAREELRDHVKGDKGKFQKFWTTIGPVFQEKIKDEEYVKRRLTDWVRRSKFVEAYDQFSELYNDGKVKECFKLFRETADAISDVRFETEQVIKMEHFDKERVRHAIEAQSEKKVPTLIPMVDSVLEGGLTPGELAILLAEPKMGKSIGLVHMGWAGLVSNQVVIHFVLEGKTQQTMLRYQSRMSKMIYNKLKRDDLTREERKKLKKLWGMFGDRLHIVGMNKERAFSYTILDIKAEVTELRRKGVRPSLIIIDYGDLVQPREKHENNTRAQASVFRDMKTYAMIEDIPIWTASQAQRPKDGGQKEKTLKAKDIADCYEKVRVCDALITLNATQTEKKQGRMRLHFDIYRDSPADITEMIANDYSRMIFYSDEFGALALPVKKKKDNEDEDD